MFVNLRVLDGSISIHALLAESDVKGICFNAQVPKFLSTLSLRRATDHGIALIPHQQISIHALLAESDPYVLPVPRPPQIFLSTLSLRRAT